MENKFVAQNIASFSNQNTFTKVRSQIEISLKTSKQVVKILQNLQMATQPVMMWISETVNRLISACPRIKLMSGFVTLLASLALTTNK